MAFHGGVFAQRVNTFLNSFAHPVMFVFYTMHRLPVMFAMAGSGLHRSKVFKTYVLTGLMKPVNAAIIDSVADAPIVKTKVRMNKKMSNSAWNVLGGDFLRIADTSLFTKFVCTKWCKNPINSIVRVKQDGKARRQRACLVYALRAVADVRSLASVQLGRDHLEAAERAVRGAEVGEAPLPRSSGHTPRSPQFSPRCRCRPLL
ncbi:hypothetical protein NX059_012438 [Plenodomus lindquistii]|nr:hypothetical protein NX059_012438 [Plenodomus lindquistii]